MISERKKILYIILLFSGSFCFFNYRNLVGNFVYDRLYALILVVFFMWAIFSRKNTGNKVSDNVHSILMMFAFSIFLPFIFWDQPFYSTLYGMVPIMPLCFYFVLEKLDISTTSARYVIFVMTILYSLVQISALSTFPNNLFGFSEASILEADANLSLRGVIRLNVPGADFVVISIFLLACLSREKSKKHILLLIVPLFILLITRGTRTPIVMTTIVFVGYFLMKLKNRYIAVVSIFLLGFILFQLYDFILQNDTSGILSSLVLMTGDQISAISAGDEDPRIRMTNHFLLHFNDNFFQYLLGNGAYALNSNYGKTILKLAEDGMCIPDVCPVMIFVFFGIVGLVLYVRLFVSVIRLRIEDNCQYAKLYIVYLLLISPTNVQFFYISPIIFSLILYIIQKSHNELVIKEQNPNTVII